MIFNFHAFMLIVMRKKRKYRHVLIFVVNENLNNRRKTFLLKVNLSNTVLLSCKCKRIAKIELMCRSVSRHKITSKTTQIGTVKLVLQPTAQYYFDCSIHTDLVTVFIDFSVKLECQFVNVETVSYTHLTLPTNREV